MRVCGIICEYNPFHNGHAYHIQKAREMTKSDYVICVMSTWFTQRGEAAMLDPFLRAHMALLGGADLVLALPAEHAVRDAEHFAKGGVALLGGLGVCTHLSFGSEEVDPDALARYASAWADESGTDALRANLQQGKAWVRARDETMLQNHGVSIRDMPNLALALEYLRALSAVGSGMIPVPVQRMGAGYHDLSLSAHASASAIRAAFYQGRGEMAMHAMPKETAPLLSAAWARGEAQAHDGLDTPLLAFLRAVPHAILASACDVSEGLERRIQRHAQKAVSREDLLARIKTKRYTHARLSRACTQAFLGITKERSTLPVKHARVLGFRKTAAPLIKQIARQAAFPVLTHAAACRQADPEAFLLEARAADLWALGVINPAYRQGDRAYTTPVVTL